MTKKKKNTTTERKTKNAWYIWLFLGFSSSCRTHFRFSVLCTHRNDRNDRDSHACVLGYFQNLCLTDMTIWILSAITDWTNATSPLIASAFSRNKKKIRHCIAIAFYCLLFDFSFWGLNWVSNESPKHDTLSWISDSMNFLCNKSTTRMKVFSFHFF